MKKGETQVNNVVYNVGSCNLAMDIAKLFFKHAIAELFFKQGHCISNMLVFSSARVQHSLGQGTG